MSNKNDPKYEKIKGKLERIIPLREPQRTLALHRIATEQQESFDDIQNILIGVSRRRLMKN